MTAPTPAFTGPVSAADHLATFISDRFLIDGTDRPTIYKILDALLAGGTLREVWGARYHNPDDGNVDTWCGSREEAERMIAARYQGVAPWPHRSSLIRWFVIVTAAEVTQ